MQMKYSKEFKNVIFFIKFNAANIYNNTAEIEKYHPDETSKWFPVACFPIVILQEFITLKYLINEYTLLTTY